QMIEAATMSFTALPQQPAKRILPLQNYSISTPNGRTRNELLNSPKRAGSSAQMIKLLYSLPIRSSAYAPCLVHITSNMQNFFGIPIFHSLDGPVEQKKSKQHFGRSTLSSIRAIAITRSSSNRWQAN